MGEGLASMAKLKKKVNDKDQALALLEKITTHRKAIETLLESVDESFRMNHLKRSWNMISVACQSTQIAVSDARQDLALLRDLNKTK